MFALPLRRYGAAQAGGPEAARAGGRGAARAGERGAARAGGPGAVAAAIALAALAAGCAHPVKRFHPHTVDLTVTEYRLRPDDLVTTPGPLTLIAHNLGRLAHNVVVTAGGRSLASSRAIPPGGSEKLRLNLRVGHYTLESSIQSDAALGVEGTLSVVRPR